MRSVFLPGGAGLISFLDDLHYLFKCSFVHSCHKSCFFDSPPKACIFVHYIMNACSMANSNRQKSTSSARTVFQSLADLLFRWRHRVFCMLTTLLGRLGGISFISRGVASRAPRNAASKRRFASCSLYWSSSAILGLWHNQHGRASADRIVGRRTPHHSIYGVWCQRYNCVIFWRTNHGQRSG